MNFPRRQRQIVLLLAAILIPAAVLITLAVRVVRQEGELTEKRMADDRRAALEQLRRELAAQLENIKLQQANWLIGRFDEFGPVSTPPTESSPVVFIAALERDHIVLPWEDNQTWTPPTQKFIDAQYEAEAREFLGDDPQGALEVYSQTLNLARTPQQRCQIGLRIGRVLLKSGKSGEASEMYHSMLRECDELRDQDGMSFGLYAAERLISTELDPGGGREYALKKAQILRWRPPVQLYLIRTLLQSGAQHLELDHAAQTISAEINDEEQIVALSRDLERLGRLELPFHANAGPRWLAYGDEPWLISMISGAPSDPPAILAVSAKKVASPDVHFSVAESAEGVPLGEGFLDLQVEWAPGRFARSNSVPPSLYAMGIALILGVTTLAAYLLLRDVNREVQIAEMRSHFVASVSHELKTPLTAIRMFAETLSMGRDVNVQKRSEYLETIVNESERLSRLVDNVLDFSRIERGKKIYQMQLVSLADVVGAAVRAFQYPLTQQGFTLDVAIEDVPPARVDADAMEQAVLNLLANAVKYSDSSRRVALKLSQVANDAVIEVTDWGMGIASEDQARIFEKFYRVRSQKTDRVPGAGLGLTLALHAVKAHGGNLEVQSEVGRGSTFLVRIPLHCPSSKEART